MQNNEEIHIDHDHEVTHVHEEHDEETPKKGSVFVRTVMIIGILVILFLISISIVKIVPKTISSIGSASVFLSSVFKPGDKVEVTLDKTEVQDGDNVLVSWKKNTPDEGSYSFSYDCVPGVTLDYQSTSGQKPVVCDTLFPLPIDSNSYPFKISSTNTSKTDVTFTVDFWKKDTATKTLSGSVKLTVLPENVYSDATTTSNVSETPSVTVTQTNTSPSTPAYSTGASYTQGANYGTSPNLSISLVKAGGIDPYGNYSGNNSASDGQRVLVSFVVSNIGNAPSGVWGLNATLPTKIASERNYSSNYQPSLKPGDSYQMNLAFDSFDSSSNRTVTIYITNAGDVNTSNNTLSFTLGSSGSSYYGGSSYYNYYYNYDNYYDYNYGDDADLEVRITDVGTMGYNGQFYYTNNFDENDRVAVKFTVRNIGGDATGSWSFRAELPTSDGDTYNSGTQPSLAPGQTTEFTLGFDNPDEGSGKIFIEAELRNNDEDNEDNNDDSETIYVDY